MKSIAPLLLLLALFATACQVRPPDISAPAVSPAPLLQDLDAQRKKLVSVKAVARLETERKGKRRSYESVAVVMDGRGRLRVEGFGPLGESLFALIGDGQTILLRPPQETEFLSVGQAGLERALGVAISLGDLCAALGGNVLLPQSEAGVRAGCESGGHCIIQFPGDGGIRRIYVSRPSGEGADVAIADGEDRYDGGTIVYRGRFEDRTAISGYSFPQQVTLENPDRALRLMVRYEEVEVNMPVEEGLFLGDSQ